MYGRGRLLPFLAGLLLPALGFLRHCLLSPPSCGMSVRERRNIARGCRLARSPTSTLSHWLKLSHVELHKRWPELTALIPDVDYGRSRRSVKHNVQKKSKKCAEMHNESRAISIAL